MLDVILGETVTVSTPAQAGEDAYGQAVKEWADEDVRNVLVCQPTSDDVASRPEGDEVTLTLHFPKTYTASLRGCTVTLRGERYTVLGDPVALTEANTPGRWNRAVPVRRVEG